MNGERRSGKASHGNSGRPNVCTATTGLFENIRSRTVAAAKDANQGGRLNMTRLINKLVVIVLRWHLIRIVNRELRKMPMQRDYSQYHDWFAIYRTALKRSKKNGV